MEKLQCATVSPRGQLESREQIDSLHVGAAESAQIAPEGSRDGGGHLKIDRRSTQKSSPSDR
jgi:hypothetical protein